MTKALFIIAAAALAQSPAAAKDIVVVAQPTAHVTYADLDLTSEAGVVTLTRRIRSAASDLCVEKTVRPLNEQLAQRACFESAVADGLEQASRLVTSRREFASVQGASLVIRAR